jgi:hypothetical protein
MYSKIQGRPMAQVAVPIEAFSNKVSTWPDHI